MRKIILSSMGLLSSCVPNPDPEKNTKLHFLKQILKNVQRCDCDIVPPDYVFICLFSSQTICRSKTNNNHICFPNS